MRTIELGKDGVCLNTLILNPDGQETIVMVHGMFGNLAQFYMTIAPELSRDYRIILYDIRSHGKSTRHETGYSLESLADDIKCLLDILNVDKCHILGFSYGTLIALKFSMMFKERVKKIIAIEIPSKFYLSENLKGCYELDNFLAFANTLPALVHKNFMQSKRQVDNSFQMYEYIYNGTSFIEDMNLDGEFTKEDYQLLDGPLLLLFGDESECIYEFNRVSSWIENKEVRFLKGGHNFFSERPAETVLAVREFLMKPKQLSFND